MQLEEWRRSQGLTYSELGQMIGTGTEMARRFCLPLGQRWRNNPSIPQLLKIMEITGGAVQAHDFVVPAPSDSDGAASAPGGAGSLASDACPAVPLRGSAGQPLKVTSAAGRKAALATREKRRRLAEVEA